MIILIAIVVVDIVILAGTIWSTRRRPVRAQIPRRADDMPHAL